MEKNMMLTERTGILTQTLPLAEFRAHLRLATGFADDAAADPVLEAYLLSAITAIEARLGKALFVRDFGWRISRWRGRDRQGLPIGPVQSLDAVTLVLADGTNRALDTGIFVLDRGTQTLCARGVSLPVIPTGAELELVFTAGFGANWAAVPADLRQAVLLLASNYFENRQGRSDGGDAIPFGIMALLEPYRNLRLGGAAA